MFSPLVDVFGDQEVIRLFSEESLVAAWLEFERALADAQAELGVIPSEAAGEIAAIHGATEFAGAEAGDRSMGPDFSHGLTYMLAVRKPIIAAVNGPCAGMGFSLAMFCDMRFAAEHGIRAAFFGVDSTRAAPDFYERVYSSAVEAGAREVVVVDTLGIASPEAVALFWCAALAE